MGRTFSLLGMVMFTVGIVALSSLTRRTQQVSLAGRLLKEPHSPARFPKRAIPVFCFEAPFSLN